MNTTRDAIIATILILALVFGGLWIRDNTQGGTLVIDHNKSTIQVNLPTPTPTACIVLNGKQVCGPKG